MEINNVTEITVKKELTKSQIVAETRLTVQGGATKVLGINPSLTLSVTECFSGEVRVSGSETLDLMYLSGEEVSGGSVSVDFTDRIECKASASTKAIVSGRVLDTDIVSIDGDGIRLASVIEITVYEMCAFALPSAELPQGVYGDERRLKCSSVTSHFSEKAAFEGEEIFKAENLICVGGRVVISGSEAALDTVIVSGEIIIDASGRSGDNIVCGVIYIPFTEEISARSARSGDTVRICARSCRISSIESGEGFSFAATVVFDGEVYCKSSVDLLSDVFSVTNAVNKERQTVSLNEVKSVSFFHEKVDGSVILPEGDSADTILALIGFEFISENAYPFGGKVMLDGAVSGNIVYYDADAAAKKTVSALIPVKLTVNAEADDGDIIEISGNVGKIVLKIRRNGEIDIKADLSLQITVRKNLSAETVSAITLGENLSEQSGAISVYISGEGESLYNCAKALCASPQVISEQNPSLEFPLKRGQRVMVYRIGGDK